MTKPNGHDLAEELKQDYPNAAQQGAAQPTRLQMMEQHQRYLLDISGIASHFAVVFSGHILPGGHVRITYGDQIDRSVPPRFYGSFTSPIEQIKGLHGLLGQMIEGHDAVTRAAAEAEANQSPDVGERRPSN